MLLGVSVLLRKGVSQEVQWIDRRDISALGDVFITVNDVLCPGIDLLGVGLY